MTDQVHTITMSEEAQAAFESGRKIGFNEGTKAASGYMTDRANGCPMHYMAETYRLYAEAILALSMPAPTQGWQVRDLDWNDYGHEFETRPMGMSYSLYETITTNAPIHHT